MKDLKNINYWYITGLTDAEGSFIVGIYKDDTRPTEYNVQLSFELGLKAKDKDLLEYVKSCLEGVGKIYYNKSDDTYKYKVSNINDLSNVIIPHFKTYYLLTQKHIDYDLFSEIVELVKNKEHLTTEGLQNIVNIKTALNLGITDDLLKNFPETNIRERSIYDNSYITIPDPCWLSGFSEGESCFYINLYRSSKSRLGWAVQLVFKITQHSRDKELLKSISNYLECGRVENRKGEACDFVITSIKYIEEKLIPFFTKNPLRGSKSLEYSAFKKAFSIMKNKDHLKEQGLEELRSIKNYMNTKRGK
jgi:hypothetical protein